jgi:16S rRNA (adenine1518-N6/adenine1519-N6)-dimethyltransferase
VARQRLGQHFLTNRSILNRIAVASCPEPVETVVEIGPGRGALTERLLERAQRVVAIEIDAALAALLRRRFADEPRLEVVEGDALQTDMAGFGHAPIVGNLPYYLASAIVDRAVRLYPPRAVFLVQKEVAERLCARPGERDYGYLTVRTRTFASARVLFAVKPGAFTPPPKVESAVVVLEPRPGGSLPDDLDSFLSFAGRCFQYKRKTIRNNLAGLCGRETVDGWPEAGTRAETLSLEQLAEMYRRLSRGSE